MSDKPEQDNRDEFETYGQGKPASLLAEFWYFLRGNKKWWLLPLLATLAVYGIFLIVSVSGGMAFMYTLF